MSDETTHGENAEEHHRAAREHDPDERPPEERREGGDMAEEGLLEGVSGARANRPSG